MTGPSFESRQILEAIERLGEKQERLATELSAMNARLAVNETLHSRVAALEAKHGDLHADFTALKARVGLVGAGTAIVVSAVVTALVKFLWPAAPG